MTSRIRRTGGVPPSTPLPCGRKMIAGASARSVARRGGQVLRGARTIGDRDVPRARGKRPSPGPDAAGGTESYGSQDTILLVLASDRIRQSASPTFSPVREYPLPKILLAGPGLACVLNARVMPMLSR